MSCRENCQVMSETIEGKYRVELVTRNGGGDCSREGSLSPRQPGARARSFQRLYRAILRTAIVLYDRSRVLARSDSSSMIRKSILGFDPLGMMLKQKARAHANRTMAHPALAHWVRRALPVSLDVQGHQSVYGWLTNPGQLSACRLRWAVSRPSECAFDGNRSHCEIAGDFWLTPKAACSDCGIF